MVTSPDVFFIFFKFLFSGLLGEGGGGGGGGGGVKGQKMAQNEKTFFVSLHISGTVPHVIVVFGTHG